MTAFDPLNAVAVLFDSPPEEQSSFRGTCFAFRSRSCLLTAAHCVRGVTGDRRLAVLAPLPHVQWHWVQTVEEHPTADIALLRLEDGHALPSAFWGFVSNYGLGEDFVAYGFPENFIGVDGAIPTQRLFKGHFQRIFQHSSHMGFEYEAVEMSIPAPIGLSGGPLFRPNAPPMITGLVTENFESTTALEAVEDRLDDGRERRIVYQRLVSYGIAVLYESNFFKYFAMNFNHLGLSKLLTTCYTGSPISGEQLPLLETAGLRDSKPPREPYKVEISEVHDLNEDGAIDLLDVEHLLRHDANVMTPLSGDGDFRSKECVALIDESDIVVTNPPFSLFREYINLLIDKGKSFLVLGDQNGAKYATIFQHIVANKLWFGYENGGTKWFRVPNDYEIKTESRKKVVDGVKFHSMGRIYWYTNLDTTKRHAPLDLYKRYSPEEYPTYTNYSAIEVARVAKIPMDYDGEMGVPITFLDKYNPNQFEIIGISTQLAEPMSRYAAKEDYATAEGKVVGGTGKLFYPLGNGKHHGVYERIIVRRIGATS